MGLQASFCFCSACKDQNICRRILAPSVLVEELLQYLYCLWWYGTTEKQFLLCFQNIEWNCEYQFWWHPVVSVVVWYILTQISLFYQNLPFNWMLKCNQAVSENESSNKNISTSENRFVLYTSSLQEVEFQIWIETVTYFGWALTFYLFYCLGCRRVGMNFFWGGNLQSQIPK